MTEEQEKPLNSDENAWLQATHLSNALPDQGVYVAFTSPTCGPCAGMKPILERVAKEVGRNLAIIDVTQVKGLAVAFNIRAVPTVMRLIDGMPVTARMVGAQNEAAIREFLKV